MNKLSWRHHLSIIALYAVVGAFLWWPLPRFLTTHVPGSETWAFDEYTFVWNLWWFKAALLQFGQSPLATDRIFYPLGIDLVLYTYNLFNALVAFPVTDLLGLVLTSNLILIGMTGLSGWGTFLLLRWLFAALPGGVGGDRQLRLVAALGGGALYAFGAFRSVYAALGHYDLVSTGFIPLFALFFLKTLWRPGWRAPILGGLFLAAALLNEMIFGVFLAMLALMLLAWGWRGAASGWVARMAAMAGVAALVWFPVGIPVVRAFGDGDFALQGWGDALKLSADALSFFAPVSLHPLWGGDWVRELRAVQEGNSRFLDVNTVYVGVGATLLALLGAWRWRRAVSAWGWGALLFAIFSLGPLLQLNGRSRFNFDGIETGIPLPFIILHYLPIIKGNRAPNRFSVVLLLCVAVLAGWGLLWLGRVVARRLGGRQWRGVPVAALLPGAVAALLVVEQVALPLPLTDAQVPAIYRTIAAEPGDFSILSLPLGWRNSFGVLGSEDTRTQFYSTVHGKRLPSGNISRNPPFKFDYFRTLPVFRTLIKIEADSRYQPTPEEIAADQAQAAAVAELLDLRYVVANPPIPGRPPYNETYTATLAYVQTIWPLAPVASEGPVRAFRVSREAVPPSRTVDVGSPEARLFLGEGWDRDESVAGAGAAWVTGGSARLFMPLGTTPTDVTVTLRLAPFGYPGAPPQTVALLVNGTPVGEPRTLPDGWSEVAFSVPAARVRPGTNALGLRFGRATRPRDVLPESRLIGGSGVALDQEVTATSGGSASGQELGYITVAGENASDNRRGVNVTVLEPGSGAVVAVRGFDTAANEYETARLVEFIQTIPAGQVVVATFQGDALAHFTPAARDAFATLGAGKLPAERGASYALIGVKGAPPGSASEESNPTATAYREHRPDPRPLSAAVDWVRWEAAP